MATSKNNYSQMAAQIVENLGGKKNITSLNHCATRLRITLADPALVRADALKKVNHVMGTEQSGNDFQVIVGGIIESVYPEVEKLVGGGAKTAVKQPAGKKSPGQLAGSFLLMMAGIMSPLIPALVTAGFLSTLLTIGQMAGLLTTESSTYIILNNFAQAAFYFLPIYVAYTAAKKFDTEPVLAMLLAAGLLYPGWVDMVNNATTTFTTYFGLPVYLVTYNGGVIQIVLSVFVMAQIDKLLKKIIPEAVRHFLKPFLLLLITSVITLTITGPMGALFTNYLAAFINFVQTHVAWLTVPAIIAFATTIGQLCAGFHLALIPLATASLASVGYDSVINIWFFCCTITPGFIALAVALKTRNRNCRQVAIPACLSALFGGISEPTTYGIEYKMVKPFYAFVVTSFSTSILAGLMNLKCYAFGGYSLTNILLYLGPNYDWANFRNAIICVVFMAVMSFVTVYAFGFDDSVYNEEEDTAPAQEGPANVTLTAPAKGAYVAQADIADSTFANGVLGKCFGIKPSSNSITAPVAGTVTSVAQTKHAVTITADGGAQIMVHIGLDSVKLNGEGLNVTVTVGQHVKVGDTIAKYDPLVFTKAGIDDTVVCILLNSDEYASVACSATNAPLIATV